MRSQTFAALVSKWCWLVLLADPATRQSPPRNFQKDVQLLVQLNIWAGYGHACWVNKVIICSFVEYHANPVLLSLQIMAMLTWKEMPCVENLQIAYCVNCRNTNIPGYCCQRSVFCDCYRSTWHILCSVERTKRFVNVHMHCIVRNAPSKVCKYTGPLELLRSEISFSRSCNIPKQWNSSQTRSYMNEICILFVCWWDCIFII